MAFGNTSCTYRGGAHSLFNPADERRRIGAKHHQRGFYFGLAGCRYRVCSSLNLCVFLRGDGRWVDQHFPGHFHVGDCLVSGDLSAQSIVWRHRPDVRRTARF